MLLVALLLALLAALTTTPAAVLAYRDREYIASATSAKICTGFFTNTSDPYRLTTQTGADAALPCQHGVTPGSLDVPFYLFNYPKHINFELRGHTNMFTPTSTLAYRVTVLASWGSLLSGDDLVKFKCDAHGDAVFFYAALRPATPQRVFTQDWSGKESSSGLTGGFDLVLAPEVRGDAPRVGDGVVFSVAICPLSASSATMDMEYDLDMRLQIGFAWGDLHPTMWAEMILLIVVSIPKLALVVWFVHRCWMFKDHVMQQQKWFLFSSTFSLLAALAYLIFLLIANENGMDTTCCPAPVATSVLVGFKFASNMVFDLLLLATCKGWGVVVNTLESRDVGRILAYFSVSMLMYVFSQLFGVSLEIAWLMVIIESGLWLWIFLSLNHTREMLSSSGRLDRHAKLEMYDKLKQILKRAFGLWVLVGIAVITVVIYCYAKYNRLDAVLLAPSTLGWDLTLLYMMVSFGYVWRPSPATAAFSYSFAKRDDENAYDLSRSVEQFGLEEIP